MTIGPVEYIIVGFPGNRFNGEIAPELADLVESGTVRILDLVFIGKDADGSVVAFELDELDAAAGFGQLDADVGGLISPEDIEYAAAALEPELVCGPVDLGGFVGGAVRRSRAQLQGRPSRGGPYPTRTHRARAGGPSGSGLSYSGTGEPEMIRRRPIARAAVRTTAVVGTAAVVGGHMANKQSAQTQQAAPEPAAPTSAPAAAAPDPVEQLTQLAALKDSGALTEAEFEAQKAKILG